MNTSDFSPHKMDLGVPSHSDLGQAMESTEHKVDHINAFPTRPTTPPKLIPKCFQVKQYNTDIKFIYISSPSDEIGEFKELHALLKEKHKSWKH